MTGSAVQGWSSFIVHGGKTATGCNHEIGTADQIFRLINTDYRQ